MTGGLYGPPRQTVNEFFRHSLERSKERLGRYITTPNLQALSLIFLRCLLLPSDGSLSTQIGYTRKAL